MRRGSLPSWDLGAWSGQPLVGDPQVGVLYPLNWLWLLLHPLRSYAWLQLIHVGVGAAGMWALARARGRSQAAAAVAALSLGLGAFLVLELRHAMFVATTAWLPWLMWSIERYAQRRRLEDLIVMAGATGLALLAGGWSMLYFGAIVVLILALSRVQAAPQRARLLGAYAAAAVVGLLLAAAQLLPALAHARQSPRALGVDYAFASSYAWPSWKYLITLLFPTWYGSVARGTYTGAPDQWELCGYAIGTVATLLVPFSLRLRERRGERIALLVAVLVACDLARGDGGLLHPLFFRYLPMYGSLRCPARALYLWTLAAPILAADGLDALCDWLPERRRALAGGVVALAVALELTIVWRGENPSTTLAATQARPKAIEWLKSVPPMGRAATDVHLGQRYHNAGLRWAFDSAVGYSSLPIWRYLHLLWIANHGRVYPHDKLADDLTAQGLWTWGSRLVDLLSVSLVLAPHDRPISDKGWERIFTGSDGIDVWRNRHAYPIGFVVYRAITAKDAAEAARLVADPSFLPGRLAILEKPEPRVPSPHANEAMPAATQALMVVRETPDDLSFEVVTPATGVLVIADPWYPGWSAAVDGVPAELLRVDYALRGVVLPPGRHTVTLVYFNEPLAWGGALSLLALVFLAGLAIVARRRREPLIV
jgi:hypothetical protein